MTARRFLLLGSFLTSILAACSSHNSFFFGDGGLDGSSEPAEQTDSNTSTTKKDAGKKDSAIALDDAQVEEEDGSFVDAAKKDASKPDVSTFDTNTCTISITSGNATCDSCIEGSCCVEVNNCFDNTDCSALDTCIGNCLDLDAALQSACASTCNSNHASSSSKWQAAANCIQGSCSSSCN